MGTNGKTKRKLEEVLTAIEGSGGVKMVIAQRLRISRPTLDNYLLRWASARDALESEEQGVGDIAKSIIIQNMRAAMTLQQESFRNKQWERAIVDTSDARWWLKMKLRDEFSERQEHTGASGQPIQIKRIVENRPDDQSDEYESSG